MKLFRTWFTPGSVVATMLVALLWLHELPWSLAGRAAAQVVLVSLTFAGLWMLTQDRQPDG
ncbi:MAG: hypothetical protein HGA45_08415 [Chloroflexales bacterium]|nr:hypothetical protein [Chloroflexales bacterium]